MLAPGLRCRSEGNRSLTILSRSGGVLGNGSTITITSHAESSVSIAILTNNTIFMSHSATFSAPCPE